MGVTTQKVFDKFREVIPGGVNSPVRAFIGLGIDPLVVQRGEGDRIYDVDGKEYIDYCMSWGALLLGHADPEVIKEVTERAQQGSSFGVSTPVEEALARLIVEAVGSIEKVRFVSSGTEATMTAVRVARGYTGRFLVVKFDGNYHGHSDSFLVRAGWGARSGTGSGASHSSSEGVPIGMIKETISLPYNDVPSFCRFMRDPLYAPLIGAVILEPIAANMGVVIPTQEFIQAVREESERVGALLIFDEVITGFRVGFKGAEEYFEVSPDLTCLGKVMGGGFPAAALGGRAEVMDVLAPIGAVYQAGTLSGNPVCMQAGLTTLRRAKRPHFYTQLEEKARLITEPVREALVQKDLPGCIEQVGGMFTLFFGPRKVSGFKDLEQIDMNRFRKFFKFLLDHGVYFSPSPYEACFVSSAHTPEHLRKTRELILEFIRRC